MIIDVHIGLCFPNTGSCWHISWDGIARSCAHFRFSGTSAQFPQRLYQFTLATAVYRVPLFLYSCQHLNVFLMIAPLIWVCKNFKIVIICYSLTARHIEGVFGNTVH